MEISALVGLLVVGALVYFFNRSQIGGGVPRVSADAKFAPLSVQEPQLRLDLLAKLQKEESLGAHRNIFNATPPPPDRPSPEQKKSGTSRVRHRCRAAHRHLLPFKSQASFSDMRFVQLRRARVSDFSRMVTTSSSSLKATNSSVTIG